MENIINIAEGKVVTSSSLEHGGTAEKAVDGESNEGKYKANGVCARTKKEYSSIQVDMDKESAIKSIKLVGRADECNDEECRTQSTGWTIRVGNTGKDLDPICKENVDAYGGKLISIHCQENLSGRYVSVFSSTWIVLCEIQVFIESTG